MPADQGTKSPTPPERPTVVVDGVEWVLPGPPAPAPRADWPGVARRVVGYEPAHRISGTYGAKGWRRLMERLGRADRLLDIISRPTKRRPYRRPSRQMEAT